MASDSRSSAEVSESINSMWDWYAVRSAMMMRMVQQTHHPTGGSAETQDKRFHSSTKVLTPYLCRRYRAADHCIAYLRDVRPLSAGWSAVTFDLRKSEWFERGWTWQELVAPSCVVFLARDDEMIKCECSDSLLLSC